MPVPKRTWARRVRACWWVLLVLVVGATLLALLSGRRSTQRALWQPVPADRWKGPLPLEPLEQFNLFHAPADQLPSCRMGLGAAEGPESRRLDAHYEQAFAALHGNASIFLVANLHQSQGILSAWTSAVLQFVVRMRAYGISVFVSVYESGSTDRTQEMLRTLQAKLTELGIRNRIHTSGERVNWRKVYRIEELARLRNLAMQPMLERWRAHQANPSTAPAPFDQVLFLNDVVTCVEDLLELARQQLLVQQADITCGVDWWHHQGYRLYDTWVVHSTTGKQLDIRIPENDPNATLPWDATDDMVSPRIDALVPFQVLSCWNGMVMLRAEPFYRHALAFRHNRAPTPARAPTASCDASECYLICKDFWHHGHRKIAMVPQVTCAYALDIYQYVKGHVAKRVAHLATLPGSARLSQPEGIEDWVTTSPAHFECVDIKEGVGGWDAMWANMRVLTPEQEGLDG